MLSRHTHVVSDLATSNTRLARKPLLAHSWRSKVSGNNSCPCGRTVNSSEQARSSRYVVKVFAATATSARPKASPKKRKQVEPLLVAEDVSKSHDGQRFLFENLNFTVSRGDRLALVGPNGAGKSSLFNLLSDADQPDTGVIKRRKGMTVGYLSQDPKLDESAMIMDAVLQSGSSVSQAVRRYEQATAQAAAGETSSKHQKEMDKCFDEMNAMNGWEVSADAHEILESLGMPDTNRLVSGLSGGQKRRVALAAALLAAPDLLILDEPTNHMDLGAIKWMEERLTGSNTTLILVTHDRVFMEAVCTGILELDQGTAHLHSFGGPGSYNKFRQAQYERHAAQAAVAQTAKVQLRKETEWMRRQPKARSTKSKSRQDAFYELSDVARSGPKKDVKADFGGAAMSRQGKKVLVMEDTACKAGERTIVRNFWYEFAPGERIGIVGPNGAGKSSLLDMITGDRHLAGGHREVGETTALGYFRQHVPDVKPTLKIIDYIREVADDSKVVSDGTSLADKPEIILERLGFARPRQQQLVNSLSGGERRRLQLAAVLVEKPNLLILDEPTNDLDLQTVEVVEELLSDYKGCLLVVSHDRAFMENLADRLFVVSGDGLVRLYDGLYSEYLETLDEMEAIDSTPSTQTTSVNSASVSTAASGSGSIPVASTSSSHGGPIASIDTTAFSPSTSSKGPPLGYREKQEYAQLESQIDGLSSTKDNLEQQLTQLAGNAGKHDEMLLISEQLAALMVDIDNRTERWLELADRAEQHISV